MSIAEKHPILYGQIQYELGTAFDALAGVRDEKQNLTCAIHAYEEALKISAAEKYPLLHNGR